MGLPLPFLVLVQYDLLGRGIDQLAVRTGTLAAMDGVAQPLFGTSVVEVRSVSIRYLQEKFAGGGSFWYAHSATMRIMSNR